ncbi:hypothetical protein SUGI_0919680 [Cryptomeria japonica]|nr:hypothetical protein SUGI_0919680 [Cryptomeria japonica]
MAAATLSKSTISFRRQGSSGIVWGLGSSPGEFDFGRYPFLANDSEHVKSSSTEAPELFRSRSTGFLASSKVQRAYVHRDKITHHSSHKSRFNLGRWIKKVLSKTIH